jgi:hypothetical protein
MNYKTNKSFLDGFCFVGGGDDFDAPYKENAFHKDFKRFIKSTFFLDWKNNEHIENYSKIFSYFTLAIAVIVSAALSYETKNFAPVIFTSFLALFGFVVGEHLDQDKKALFYEKCKYLQQK